VARTCIHNRDRFTFHDMLSNRYRLDQINEALEAMRAFHEVKPVVVMAS
jgi:Zn-dependent alcohol dehydrogenase